MSTLLALGLPDAKQIAVIVFAVLGVASLWKRDWKFGLLGCGLALAFWPW